MQLLKECTLMASLRAKVLNKDLAMLKVCDEEGSLYVLTNF